MRIKKHNYWRFQIKSPKIHADKGNHAALKIKILLVLVNWLLQHQSIAFPFDENELQLWNMEFWQLKKTVKTLLFGKKKIKETIVKEK